MPTPSLDQGNQSFDQRKRPPKLNYVTHPKKNEVIITAVDENQSQICLEYDVERGESKTKIKITGTLPVCIADGIILVSELKSVIDEVLCRQLGKSEQD